MRDGAIQDYLSAVKASITLHKETGKPFVMKFKSKKKPSDSIVIKSNAYEYDEEKGGVLFYRTFWKAEPLQSSEELPKEIKHSVRIQKTRYVKQIIHL